MIGPMGIGQYVVGAVLIFAGGFVSGFATGWARRARD